MFQVKTTKDTPVGSHKSLFCQVTITQNGEPIVGTVGTTELQVNAPAVAAAAPAAADAPSRPQAAAARQAAVALGATSGQVFFKQEEEAMNDIPSDSILWAGGVLIGFALLPGLLARRRGAHGAARISQRSIADDRPRCAIDRRSGRICERHHARCDRKSRRGSSTATTFVAQDGNRLLPQGDGDAKLTATFESLECRRADHRCASRRRSADQFQARCHAGVHEGRLQRGQLPRRGPRQGRFSAVAVRVRSGRRLLPADARAARAAARPVDSQRVPAHRKSDRPSAAHGRQPHQEGRSVLSNAAALAGKRRAGRCRRSADGRLDRSLSRQRRCWMARAKRSSSPCGPSIPTARTATSRTSPCSCRATTTRRPFDRRQGDGRQSRRSVRHGPLRKAHGRRAVHRAAEGAGVSMEGSAGQQLHRRAGVRQAAAAADSAIGAVHAMPSSFAA